MEKLDLKKELKNLYRAKENIVEEIRMPKLKYLMIDGNGDPNKEEYQLCMNALYGVSYTLKFSLKKENKDFVVMPLESLWYCNEEGVYLEKSKDSWRWTAMILMPNYINEELVNKAVDSLKRKKDNSKLNDIYLKEYDEGLIVQTMHIGSYDDEAKTVKQLNDYMNEKGFVISAAHHEIYFSDPRRVSKEKLRTIIRIPIEKKHNATEN